MLVLETIYAMFAPVVVTWFLARFTSVKLSCRFADKRKAIICYSLLLPGLAIAILGLHWFSLGLFGEAGLRFSSEAGFNLLLVIMIVVASILAFAVTNIWSTCAIPAKHGDKQDRADEKQTCCRQ